MYEVKGFNGYGFNLAFHWLETTDGYPERHPDYSGACNPDLLANRHGNRVKKSSPVLEQVENVFYLFGAPHPKG